MVEFKQAIDALAGLFHEDWRKTRLKEDGSYEPRWKKTTDANFISEVKEETATIRFKDGNVEVDIANTKFADLPFDWQKENLVAALTVINLLDAKRIEKGPKYTKSEIEQLSSLVHDAWLARNPWAKGGELDVPYDKLLEVEKAKDRRQVVQAIDEASKLFKTVTRR